jgi:hypothetical protein
LKPEQYIGRFPDALALKERLAIAGKWIALESYSPKTLPLRIIQAIGDSPSACLRMLRERGLDPRRFEFIAFKP